MITDQFLGKLIDLGFSGVQNFPSVGLIDGRFRANLEETGMGYGLEVDLIRAAAARGLLTTPYVFSEADAQDMARAGADIIVVPAAFTMMTGKDHWEVLLRARAIETQAYVLAPGQTGNYIEEGIDRTNYGNSLVADPWGTVIARAQDRVGWVNATLDFDYLRKIRSDLPSNKNRVLGLEERP